MKTDTVIVRYSEVGLKGKNRNDFENRLVKNIRACLEQNNIPYEKVWKIRGRIFINTQSGCNELGRVCGIQSFSPSLYTEADMDHIKIATEKFLQGAGKKTMFRISAHRGDKTPQFTSEDIERAVGAYVIKMTGAKVSLKNFDLEIGIEIYEGKAFVFAKRNRGPGGLPAGSSGKVCVIYETERSIAAAWLMMKRGCSISILCKKKNEHIEKLVQVSYGIDIKIRGIEDFPSIQEEAAVSEQSIETLEKYNIDAVILRPLVGYTEEEISRIIKDVYF